MADEKIVDSTLSAEMLQRLDKPGPRYTSYPTAPVWTSAFGHDAYGAALARAAERPSDPLSLYVHIPFCRERCAFCGCNVIISKKPPIAETYLAYVDHELAMVAEALGERRTVSQLHWGGGTPTYLKPALLESLYTSIASHFDLSVAKEIALEADPRVTTREQLEVLRRLGFNRISMGVQDLDPGVQDAIGRHQSEAETRALFESCRDLEFAGINIDLVYGLPGQTTDTWARTLDGVIDLRPDRLAVYSYAYLPDRLHNQRHIDETLLPGRDTKYRLLAMAREAFLAAGYSAIGMDHFALPEDELSVALAEGRLNRNFMGYSVHAAPDMLGIGVSAIGEVGGAFAQNEKKLSRYFDGLKAKRFPTASGWELTEDDRIRQWAIRQVTCNLCLPFAELTEGFGVAYDDYFAAEEADLAPLYADGFVERTEDGLRLIGPGRIFVRNVAMVFDRYLRAQQAKAAFSRTI